jgi:hypothetical protein
MKRMETYFAAMSLEIAHFNKPGTNKKILLSNIAYYFSLINREMSK